MRAAPSCTENDVLLAYWLSSHHIHTARTLAFSVQSQIQSTPVTDSCCRSLDPRCILKTGCNGFTSKMFLWGNWQQSWASFRLTLPWLWCEKSLCPPPSLDSPPPPQGGSLVEMSSAAPSLQKHSEGPTPGNQRTVWEITPLHCHVIIMLCALLYCDWPLVRPHFSPPVGQTTPLWQQ